MNKHSGSVDSEESY